MAKESILVVDDEEDILELLQYNLSKEGYQVRCVPSGEEGLEVAKAEHPDLMILDLMLPGVDGLDVCKLLKNDPKTKMIPIIMLTAKGEEADVVTGLEMGADDYIVKPFSPRVVTARVKSVLRRNKINDNSDEESTLRIDDLTIHPGRHEVQVKGKLVDLTYTEFKLLQFLVRQKGWVFTRHQLVEGVHGDDYPVTERSIDVQIVGLRRKLGRYGKLVETVRGVGYRFKG